MTLLLVHTPKSHSVLGILHVYNEKAIEMSKVMEHFDNQIWYIVYNGKEATSDLTLIFKSDVSP